MDTLLEFKVLSAPEIYIIGRRLTVDNNAFSQGDIENFWCLCEEQGLFRFLETYADILFSKERIGYTGNWTDDCSAFTYVAGMAFTEPVSLPGLECIRLEEGYLASALFLIQDSPGFFARSHDSLAGRIRERGYTNEKAGYSLEVYADPYGDEHFRYYTYSLPVESA